MLFGRLKRREVIALLGAAASWPLAARAQQATARHVRVGLITPTSLTPAMLSAFRDGMHERGYVEGQNLSISVRWPQGPFEQNPGLVAELVSSNIDVIVAWATPSVVAVRRATSTIPIVMVSISDPLGLGFIASLARPGGNITGVSNQLNELSGKYFQILQELRPGLSRIAILWNPDDPGSRLGAEGQFASGPQLGLTIQSVPVRKKEDLDVALTTLANSLPEALLIHPTPILFEN